MKIIVKVKTKAKEERLEKIGENAFAVWVKEPAEKGKANLAVIKAVAKYFKAPQNKVAIVAGLSSRQKIIIIES
ncbi:MAG: DUF167 domain-containing protein [Patescibacteria group bacterium]